MTEKLKPCPFCGKPGRINEIGGAVVGQRAYSVTCTSEAYEHCLAYLTYASFARKTEAATAWNTRATGWRPIEEAEEALKDGRHVFAWGRYHDELLHRGNTVSWSNIYQHWEDDCGDRFNPTHFQEITPPDSEAPATHPTTPASQEGQS